jgi:poly-beta-1,6-N-acetyl-D-glucosamine synthase
MVAAITFANAALTASAIYFEDMQSRSYRKRDLLTLLLYTPLDFVLYRPILLWARLKGSWGFLRGDKAWHKFERNVRAPA